MQALQGANVVMLGRPNERNSSQACSLFKILTQAYPGHTLQLSLSHHSRRSRIKYKGYGPRLQLSEKYQLLTKFLV